MTSSTIFFKYKYYTTKPERYKITKYPHVNLSLAQTRLQRRARSETVGGSKHPQAPPNLLPALGFRRLKGIL